MSHTHHLQQLRAATAFRFAEAGNSQKSADANYAAAVQELSSLLKTNGLANTLAYCYSKEAGQRLLFEQINEWLTNPEIPGRITPSTSARKEDQPALFMQAVLDLKNDHYRIAQQEVLLLAGWLIRFVKKPEPVTTNASAPDDTYK